ncbi:uncharacterized protein METZ01_LOCUS492868, partial [marine metagenome]
MGRPTENKELSRQTRFVRQLLLSVSGTSRVDKYYCS